jgi:hypothetical protein
MTDSTTTKTKAASSGDTTEKHIPAQREHGMNRLREEECYHLTNLINDCLNEAEHLVRKVHGKAQGRVLDYDGSKGTKPLDRDEARKTLNEAYDCASLALTYLFEVSQHLQPQPADPWQEEAPF